MMSEKRMINLPKGGVLEVDASPAFYDKVRTHFGMFPNEHVDDDIIRMFIFGAVKGAVDRAEDGMTRVAR